MKRINVHGHTRWMISALLTMVAVGIAHSESLLINAVKNRDQATTRALIEKKVDVNESQPDGATALHWAVHRDDAETAKLLIEAGADVNATNDFGVMPLALACQNRNAQLVETLLDAGANAKANLMSGESVLMAAAHAGDLSSVDLLLEYGADIDAKEPVRQQTALMWAIGEKRTKIARRLIEQGSDIHATTTLGFTPLLFAAREGETEVAEILLDVGADVNTTALPEISQTYTVDRSEEEKDKVQKKEKGLSALHVAVLRGHVDTAMLLLEHGADPNYVAPGYSPLHWAVTSWETELDGANGMRAPKELEWHTMAGVKEGKLELVQALLEHGADPNARLKKNPSRYGFTVTSNRPTNATPYILAAYAGDADVMNMLVEHGADPTLVPNNKAPALLWAAGVGRHTAENVATEGESLAAVKAAVDHGADVNATDISGNTALHGAAWIRSPKIVQYLVDHGADVLVKNKYELTPAYIASRDGRLAGLPGPIIEDSPTLNLLRELAVPNVVKDSIEVWETLPPHIRNAIEQLLDGELNEDKAAKKK
jgi:ankyrin repeat protein